MTRRATPTTITARRGLGWDIDSAYSSNRGELLPIGSFGHTGFTGTSIWADPLTGAWIVFLSNRVHPDGHGDVTALRARVASIVASAVPDFQLAAVDRNGRRGPYVAGICRVGGSHAGAERHRRAAR